MCLKTQRFVSLRLPRGVQVGHALVAADHRSQPPSAAASLFSRSLLHIPPRHTPRPRQSIHWQPCLSSSALAVSQPPLPLLPCVRTMMSSGANLRFGVGLGGIQSLAARIPVGLRSRRRRPSTRHNAFRRERRRAEQCLVDLTLFHSAVLAHDGREVSLLVGAGRQFGQVHDRRGLLTGLRGQSRKKFRSSPVGNTGHASIKPSCPKGPPCPRFVPPVHTKSFFKSSSCFTAVTKAPRNPAWSACFTPVPDYWAIWGSRRAQSRWH
eukprot:gene41831-51850_t